MGHGRINYDLSCLPYPFPPPNKKNQGKNNEDLPRLSRFKRCTVISTKPLPSVHTPDSFEALIEGKSWCFFFIYRNKGCFSLTKPKKIKRIKRRQKKKNNASSSSGSSSESE